MNNKEFILRIFFKTMHQTVIKAGVARRSASVIILLFISVSAVCQRYLTDVDSSFFIKDTVRPVIKRFENLQITGYMQPQFQVAQAKGVSSYAGGSFSTYSRSRFMLRRARVKIEYLMPSKITGLPSTYFAFQIDATERGVIVRDMFLKVFETRKKLFSLTAGLFARPFGFEVNLSSAYRETPERGRMSQILMPGERDLGLAVTYEPYEKKNKLSHFRLDVGFFNGQGVAGTTDFDSYKDLITRLTVKPYHLKRTELSGGLSLLRGGWKNATAYVYSSGRATNGDHIFVVDSSGSNLGASAPRHYYGADLQMKIHHSWGETEFRAEHWLGTQPGTANSTTNPGTLPTANGNPLPTYIRHFNGSFFYVLQHIINVKHQILLKYDWYDPNTRVSGKDIGKTGTNLTAADIRYTTIGAGYVYHFNPKAKLIFYYDLVSNEKTKLEGYMADLKDNIFTCRLQFRF